MHGDFSKSHRLRTVRGQGQRLKLDVTLKSAVQSLKAVLPSTQYNCTHSVNVQDPLLSKMKLFETLVSIECISLSTPKITLATVTDVWAIL